MSMGSKKANSKRPMPSSTKNSKEAAPAIKKSRQQELIAQAARETRQSLSLQEMSDVIAELSESVLENPDAAFQSTIVASTSNKKGKKTDDDKDDNDDREEERTPSPMKQLLSIAAAQEGPTQEHTAHLAMLSLLAIFKDIIPDYRIRLPSEKEMAVKVSKETKQTWDFERALLHHYQMFLKLLEKTWSKKGKNETQPHQVAIVAMMSLAELLKSAFHFNFRSNLLSAVIRPMNHPIVGDCCCAAIVHVFQKDAQGEVALEAARQVAKMITNRQFKVRPAVLKTFVNLPLRVHVDEAQAAKIASQANAKKRKKDKELAAIEADLKEGEATVDKIVLARNQSDTLQAVTLTYFRILKSDNLKALEPILPACLEGLAKFAHLINLDTVVDLLQVLKELLQNVDDLPLDAALNCILTAFQTLQGPGQALKIDQKEYVVPLYSQIPRITSAPGKHVEILLKCLTAAFLKQKEYTNVRVAAFCKQIVTACMHSPPFTAVPLLAFCRQLLQRYPSTQQLLENEADVITSGEYTPDVTDPEQSNPFATSGWEVATLRFHVHKSIASQSEAVSKAELLALPSQSPERIYQQAMDDAAVFYIPFDKHIQVTKKHPLSQQASNSSSKKRQRARFITARTFESALDQHPLASQTNPFLAPKQVRKKLKSSRK